MAHVVALIPAHNEAGSIGNTLAALLDQHRVPDQIVVIPNGCVDATAEICRAFPVEILDPPRLAHKKSEVLNTAWRRYAKDADIVICLDGDTILPPNAIGDWEREFLRPQATTGEARAVPALGGSSSKFTMLGGDFLTRLQRPSSPAGPIVP